MSLFHIVHMKILEKLWNNLQQIRSLIKKARELSISPVASVLHSYYLVHACHVMLLFYSFSF